MPKKLTFDQVYKTFKDEGCELLETEYISAHTKMEYICSCGNISEIRFYAFKNGNRCIKCSGNRKITQEEAFNTYKKHGYTLRSEYKGSTLKDELYCPAMHKMEMTINNFKAGRRCRECFNKNIRLKQYIVNKKYKDKGYTLRSKYKGCMFKDELTCPEGHKIKMKYSDFKQGNRCRECYLNKNFGENNPSWNPNREEIPLNLRLRNTHTKEWIFKYMKDDLNYNNFILDPDSYVIDHIIPVKLFCQLYTKYILDETKIRKIINKRDNLQLLTCKENSDKGTKGSSLFEAANFLINNGVPLIKFLEENERI